MKSLLTIIFTTLLLIGSAHAEPIKITTTTGMIADLIKKIGGTEVAVTQLMGPGVDPHTYKPTVNDMKQLLQAEIILYNGLLLEGKMATILSNYGKKKRSIAVAEQLNKKLLRNPPEFGGHPDPHVWMDVSLWSQVAEVIATELSNYRPESADTFSANLKKLKADFLQLHSKIIDAISTIKKEQRVLVTAHDAFGYFGQAYNIEVIGIQGISTESEAGLNDINKLVDLLAERKISAVFVESSVSERNIRALIEGAAARNHSVRIGGTLYSDAMGEEGSGAESYSGMIRHNAETITKGLGGTISFSLTK